MSLSTLPEWKQLLLERKRREEEEKERREREEEERLASMPAWKRDIIQRRKAKQDEEREREREKDGRQHALDVSTITEDTVTEQMDPGNKVQNQSSKEPMSSIRQNPFIRCENSWRRDNRGLISDGENKTTNNTGRERNTEIGKEREFWRERDREMWVQRTENKSEGKEKDRCTGREQVKKFRDSSTCHFSPVTGLHTIKANNIIIIEKDKNSKERLERRESAREEVYREEKRMRMDLREFLAGGGSVTEIRASEVLIIKPPISDETAGTDRVSSRERLERESLWRRERESERDQISACRITNHTDGEVECSGRVCQLLSKFGENSKPPTRSKSTDCFDQLGKNWARYSTGDLYVQNWREEDDDRRQTFRGVPKRSFSFSDHVVCHQENGVCEEEMEFKVVERTFSDRRVKPYVMVTATDQSEGEPRVTRRWGRQKHDKEVMMHEKIQKERIMEKERNQSDCRETEGYISEEGFIVSSIKNPEGAAFARRVPVKKDERENSSERENRRIRKENEREMRINDEIETDKRRKSAIEGEIMERQRQTEFPSEQKTESKKSQKQHHSSYIQPSDNNTTTDYSVDAQCQGVSTSSVRENLQSSVFSVHTMLSQQTEDMQSMTGRDQTDRELNRTGQMFSCRDTNITSGEMKQHTADCTAATSNREQTHQTGILGLNQEEVNIPRTVFYGVDVSTVRRMSLPAGDGQGGAGEGRIGSWKAGRPLTRVESLRERIRQEEERQRSKNTEVMDDREEDRREAEGTVTQIQQEETTLQTLRLFDVTQEVTVTKSNPQLPVPASLSHLLLALSEREVREISRDESESDLRCREAKRDVEECGTRSIWRRQDADIEDNEQEKELLEEEYLPPSLSPSPPLSDSLDKMSRIYNLKAVGSRTAVCISERKGDISTNIQSSQGKYNPIRNVQSPDILPETAKLWNYGTARDGGEFESVESTGVQMVQRQVEWLQLKEQEGCASHNDKETQKNLLAEQDVKTAEGQKRPDILKETQKSQTHPRFPQAQHKVEKSQSKPQQLRSFTINARNVQPAENSTKPPEQGNCPSSSSSPTTTSSPPLFSIRSASGGAGKRGTTITITPRRSGGAASSAGTTLGSLGTPSRAVPQGQTPTTTAAGNRETSRKRYPTAEEIQVIGGYQNLERSCLVKSRGTPKAVKVCFDDIQLERVCEYPSEDYTLESCPLYPGPEDGRCGGEQEEDEEEVNVSRGDTSVSSARIRFLKVDESCKR